jgi:hypothetical protein
MILVDSSVWIEHLRVGRPELDSLLEDGLVHCHPFVIGELACGTLRRREEFLDHLNQLPSLDDVEHHEAMRLLTIHRLAGSGIDWIDVHLLASVLIAGAQLWTLDKRLAAAARSLRVAADVP